MDLTSLPPSALRSSSPGVARSAPLDAVGDAVTDEHPLLNYPCPSARPLLCFAGVQEVSRSASTPARRWLQLTRFALSLTSGHVPSSRWASSALRSRRPTRLPSSRRTSASVAVSARGSARSRRSPSSTCRPTSRPRSRTATRPTRSSCTGCRHRDRARSSVSSAPTVSARARRLRSSPASSSPTSAGTT
jgi:hypothetical protein